VHELSIVYSVAQTVTQAVDEVHGLSVRSVKLRIGALSGVFKDSLFFCWELANAGTTLSGATLEIEEVPVAIYCKACAKTQILPDIQLFLSGMRHAQRRYPAGRGTGDRLSRIRDGVELEKESREQSLETRVLEIRKNVLNKNDELARRLRAQFEASGVLVLNLVSSPGAGKTEFLQRTLTELRLAGLRVAALVGDLETDNDARRLSASGVPVRQIMTHGCCHLDASMIERHLEGWNLEELEILFIENVGNLVCPSNYDLGEAVRVALLSVTEGEDKPLKYPGMFHSADIALITKADLAVACEFDREAALANLNAVRPGMQVIEVSSKTGRGLDEWMGYLADARSRSGAKHKTLA